MVTIEKGLILMSGKERPAAFADVRTIGGLDGKVNREISKNLCVLLNKMLEISATRVYLNFMDVASGNWGWNKSPA